MTDNMDTYREDVPSTATLEYFEWEHADHVKEGLHALLMPFDDSALTYDDGRGNVVQVQITDALAFTAHKQLEFHQRLFKETAERFTRFLRVEYAEGNEIAEEKYKNFDAQIERHQKALTCYDTLKEQSVKLYRDISGKAEWIPFTERKAREAPGAVRSRFAAAKIAELTQLAPPKEKKKEAPTPTFDNATAKYTEADMAKLVAFYEKD